MSLADFATALLEQTILAANTTHIEVHDMEGGYVIRVGKETFHATTKYLAFVRLWNWLSDQPLRDSTHIPTPEKDAREAKRLADVVDAMVAEGMSPLGKAVENARKERAATISRWLDYHFETYRKELLPMTPVELLASLIEHTGLEEATPAELSELLELRKVRT